MVRVIDYSMLGDEHFGMYFSTAMKTNDCLRTKKVNPSQKKRRRNRQIVEEAQRIRKQSTKVAKAQEKRQRRNSNRIAKSKTLTREKKQISDLTQEVNRLRHLVQEKVAKKVIPVQTKIEYKIVDPSKVYKALKSGSLPVGLIPRSEGLIWSNLWSCVTVRGADPSFRGFRLPFFVNGIAKTLSRDQDSFGSVAEQMRAILAHLSDNIESIGGPRIQMEVLFEMSRHAVDSKFWKKLGISPFSSVPCSSNVRLAAQKPVTQDRQVAGTRSDEVKVAIPLASLALPGSALIEHKTPVQDTSVVAAHVQVGMTVSKDTRQPVYNKTTLGGVPVHEGAPSQLDLWRKKLSDYGSGWEFVCDKGVNVLIRIRAGMTDEVRFVLPKGIWHTLEPQVNPVMTETKVSRTG